ncbi:DUF2794 domain-containing protein [Methylocapsa aurea]|uniref:DUF2794 domain-containing protein n=1 Tax=Methylocapsa aurea TaxID=663610 RepID=UPI000569F131|nr:DUF2794 domain-containing protein [Methylocapsa aurea]
MSDLESKEDHRAASFADRIRVRRHPSPPHVGATPAVLGGEAEPVSFDQTELREILNLYGRKVAAGEWRDYAIDFTDQKAVFSIYRRASECALYRIEKIPKLAKKQGAYCVVAASGLVLKRGPDLRRVIGALDRKLKLVSG